MQKGKARHFLLWVGFIEKTRREKPGARIRCNLDTKNGSEKATKPKTLTLEDQAIFFTQSGKGLSTRHDICNLFSRSLIVAGLHGVTAWPKEGEVIWVT